MASMDEERVKCILKFAMLRSKYDTDLLCEAIMTAYKYDLDLTAYKDRPKQNLLWMELVDAINVVGIISGATHVHLSRLMYEFYTGRDS